jgi:hypothetical protein
VLGCAKQRWHMQKNGRNEQKMWQKWLESTPSVFKQF